MLDEKLTNSGPIRSYKIGPIGIPVVATIVPHIKEIICLFELMKLFNILWPKETNYFYMRYLRMLSPLGIVPRFEHNDVNLFDDSEAVTDSLCQLHRVFSSCTILFCCTWKLPSNNQFFPSQWNCFHAPVGRIDRRKKKKKLHEEKRMITNINY